MTISVAPKVRSNTKSLALFVCDEPAEDFGRFDLPSQIKTPLKKMQRHFPVDSLKVSVFPMHASSTDVAVIVNLGERKELSLQVLMRGIRAAARALSDAKQKRATFVFPQLPFEPISLVRIAAEQIPLALYSFASYRKLHKKKTVLHSVELVFADTIKNKQDIAKNISEARIVAEEINAARNLSNTPGGDMTPTVLANDAVRSGKRCGFRVSVLSEKQIRKLGMGGVLGVSKGSTEQAKYIVCEYTHPSARSKKSVVLVGKGVTFDTGGLNIKPDMSMYEMHLDMSGGAAVIHTIAAVARLRLPVRLVGLIPAVENMPGSSGYRPGDILRSYGGKTIEVKHTDAEGRIILADALGHAKTFKPETVIDIATLSGATLVALGQRASAVLSPDATLRDQLIEAGEASGDRVWPLPLWPEFKSDLASDFADIANIGKTRYGGSIIGAAFLWEFAPITRWAHIDIASTMTSLPEDNLAPGAKGSGVALLVAFIKKLYGTSAKR